MRLCYHKKAIAFSTLIKIIIIVVSAVAIILITPTLLDRAETSTAETVCRASLMAREKTAVHLPYVSSVTGDIQITPLLCKTIDKEIPKKKDAKKEAVMKEFADSMARCWWQFGNGLIDDVFKEGNPTTNNCFICYDIKTKKTSDFKEKIDGREFLEYLVKTPYKIEVEGDKCHNFGGECVSTESLCSEKNSKFSGEGKLKIFESDEKNLVCKQKYNEENNKKPVCCYSDYSCWNNGGECSEKDTKSGFVKYDKWKCPSDKKCYIKDKNYVTYARYIQSYDGYGNMIITTPIEPGSTYAVSFGSPTGECEICEKIGLITGGVAAVVIIIYTAPVSLPFTVLFGSGLVGGGALGLGAYSSAKLTLNAYSDLFKRKINTIYLTTLDEAFAESRCNIIKDVGETSWSQRGDAGGGGASGGY